MEKYSEMMERAIDLSLKAAKFDEVPVGALIYDSRGNIIAEDFNRKEITKNPLAHAEMLCIESAAKRIDNWRLTDCTMVVTLEPCLMCLSAAIHARIKKIIFGAYDKKYGAISLGHNFFNDGSLNHKIEIIGGVKEIENQKILKDFFSKLRKS